jgi:hypothetical protein
MKNTIIKLSIFILIIYSPIALSEPYRVLRALSKEYIITGFAKHIKASNGSKSFKYDFVVDNRSNNEIYSFILGEEAINSSLGLQIVELEERNRMIFTAPLNWKGRYLNTSRYDEAIADEVNFEWKSSYYTYVINPYTTTNGYSITSSQRLSQLFNSFISLSTNREKYVNGKFEYEAVKLTKGDTIAPTATITPTVTANTIKKGFYNMHFKVQAKDNYDPLPEIIFDSIQDITTSATNPSPFGAGYTLNIANSIIRGIYPTVITIAADATISKKYKINYKITDASDNQRIVSAVVTIPKQ